MQEVEGPWDSKRCAKGAGSVKVVGGAGGAGGAKVQPLLQLLRRAGAPVAAQMQMIIPFCAARPRCHNCPTDGRRRMDSRRALGEVD